MCYGKQAPFQVAKVGKFPHLAKLLDNKFAKFWFALVQLVVVVEVK